jgi:hypothetical protein
MGLTKIFTGKGKRYFTASPRERESGKRENHSVNAYDSFTTC